VLLKINTKVFYTTLFLFFIVLFPNIWLWSQIGGLNLLLQTEVSLPAPSFFKAVYYQLGANSIITIEVYAIFQGDWGDVAPDRTCSYMCTQGGCASWIPTAQKQPTQVRNNCITSLVDISNKWSCKMSTYFQSLTSGTKLIKWNNMFLK
jgi:hypothetical protein